MNYGLPIMGSKNKIAEWVLSYLPRAEHFYDLFAGGCAITHCAMLSGKFQHFHVNDINPAMPQAFLDAIHGKFKDEKRWISHDDFFRLRKKGDVYVDLCFSFGNSVDKCYAYSKAKEPIKKAIHYAVVLRDYRLLQSIIGIDISEIDIIEDQYERYLAFKRKMKHNQQALESYERLNRLQSLERLLQIKAVGALHIAQIDDVLSLTTQSYDEVKIEPNSVLYCDLPYKGTNKYNGIKFDYDKFYDWASRQEQPLFISEYDISDDRFVCIAEKKKRCTMDAWVNNNYATERIYVPKHQYKELKPLTLF